MPTVQCLFFREETFSSEEYCGGKLWAGALGDLRDEGLMETDGDESMNCNHHVCIFTQHLARPLLPRQIVV